MSLTIGSTPTPVSELIGSTAGSAGTMGFANRAYFCRYAATSGPSITKINVNFIGAGHARVAIYNDSGGSIGSLIQQTAEDTVTGAGVKTFTITSTPIVSGTNYWLAVWSDAQIIGFASGAGTVAYFDKAAPFTFDSIGFITYAGTIAWHGMISGGN
jgi:hypothetical protein